MARCLATGGQRLSCRHAGEDGHDCGAAVWSGAWPGEAECMLFGWFSCLVPGRGWVQCGPGHPEAGPDLNRLAREAEWDPLACRWRRPGDPADDTPYVRWHLSQGFALEPSARYTAGGMTPSAGEQPAAPGRN